MQHDIGLLQNKFAEQHAPLLAAGDDIDRLIDLIFGKQQPAKGARRTCASCPSGFQWFSQSTSGHFRGKIISMVLGKIAYIGIFRPLTTPAVRHQIACQAAQQRGFADAVGADNSNALFSLDQQVEPRNTGAAPS